MAPRSETAAVAAESELRADRGTIDDRWAAISQTEVPGFAGYWYDGGTGEIVVAATDPESRSAARDWAGRSSAASDFPGAPVRFDLVSYDFLQLRRWKAAARDLLGRADVVYIDADEVRNRLVVGVTPSAVTADVREATRDLDIPDAGVELVTASRGSFNRDGAHGDARVADGSPTLRDKVRPTMGGLEIESGSGGCTLGFNARLGGEQAGDVYFATASHCSLNDFSNPDNGIWRQDDLGTRVGRESHDVVPQSGVFFFDFKHYDCTGRPCRFSDASLVAYDDTIDAGDVDLGRLARTTGVVDGGSVTIAGRRDIVVKRHHSTLHTVLKVRMVGKESGTTGGSITATCVDQSIVNPDFDLRCQHKADYESTDGDSGAPVYIRHWDGTVSLIGIHFWGPPPSKVDPLFSSLAGVEADLGVTLDVCIPTGCATPPPPPDVEIDGPTEVREFSDCTYTADVTGGYPPYSYQWYIDEEPVDGDEEEGDQEELEVDVDEDSFWLQVRIEDSRGFVEWSDEIFVDVSPNHPTCQLSP